MPPVFQYIFSFFAATGILVGLLMMFVPTRYPRLYKGFLRESVLAREQTEQGRILAIRVQGLIALTGGALFALFVWAFR
jgi:hypothetical protein